MWFRNLGYDKVQDQRTIFVTKAAIFEIAKTITSNTISPNLSTREFISLHIQAKSVQQENFTKFPIVYTLSAWPLNYGENKKIDVKKKATEN